MTESRKSCLDCWVRNKAICSILDDDELKRLSATSRRHCFEPGEVVAWAGEDNSFCANVVSGVLKLTASTADGREQIVGLLFPGDFVGQVFKSTVQMTISAVVETDLCIFPRMPFQTVLDDLPNMERLLLRMTMSSLNQAQKRMLSLGKKKALERIAGFLLELARRTGVTSQSGGIDVVVPISRGELADFLGLTIETVSRQFARLKEIKIIASSKGDRELTVLDLQRLAALADPP